MVELDRATAQYMIWAFDKEAKAREALANANAGDEEAMENYRFYCRWRDDNLQQAFALDWNALNDLAFQD